MNKRKGPSKSESISDKILDLESLSEKLADLKKNGQRIVQSHGVFDLLHIGHIRHFEQARALGDVLVITLTPDEFVNKGPHRPAFTQNLRAEVIAALDCVDFVAINRWPTAEKTIAMLKPNIFAKGPDYKEKSKDITGGIFEEERSVLSVGGKLCFTEDITFSSSTLINNYIPQFDTPVNDFLQDFRTRHSSTDVCNELNKLKGLRVLVVGEAILDEYVYCNALGKSSKEPILAMHYLDRKTHAGGSLAIANHLAEFCNKVDLLTYLGSHDSQEKFVRSSLKANVSPVFVYKSDSPTLVKRRFLDQYSLTKLFEIYEMNDEIISGPANKEICDFLSSKLEAYDVVVVADFGHGLLSPEAVQILSKKSKFLAVNTQVNAANIGFHTISKYNRCNYICIHEGELRMEHRSRKGNLNELVKNLSERLSAQTVMVTRGKTGTLIYEKNKGFVNCPSFATKVIDRIGAGDAVLSITAACTAAGIDPELTGFIGNLAGAQAVTIVGNSASISRIAMLKSIESLLK